MQFAHRTLRAAAAIAVGLAVVSGGAFAQTPTPPGERQAQRVDHRQARQSDRITHGVESNQITGREQARLERQQRHIDGMERRSKADGQVTAREAVRIEHAQDRASRNIFRARHNRRQRGG